MKRPMKLTAVVVLFLAIAATAGFAQSLAVGTGKTVIDGVVKAGEYTWSQQFDTVTLYASRTADTLSLALVGSTTGWVAVGLGSLKMNGATIFMGFVDADGKVQFKPQSGNGHRHVDTKDASVADSIVSYQIKEAGGKTTLEIALKAADYIKAGQATLDLIFAVGQDKSFTPYHSSRGSVSLKLS
jgi:hypothetical protein